MDLYVFVAMYLLGGAFFLVSMSDVSVPNYHGHRKVAFVQRGSQM